MPTRAPRLACSALLIASASIGLFSHITAQTAAKRAAKPARVPQGRPVQIENGRVLGVPTPDAQVIAYKGIPYAQPPLDELRWRAPQPIFGKWKKVLYAQDFGPHCLQSGSFPDMVFHDPGQSEDCLTLNVWTPASATARPARKGVPGLPVMVWIYGGGFTTGGTSEARQDGQFLARRGVIVVSMNYRLGIFGFLSLPELADEDPHHSSGNYGLMDQAAALAWVHRNIAAFGGDPANVTIFGESAGSMSVSAQMASPIATPLFARAIGESGSAFPVGRAMPTLAQAGSINAAWATRAFGSNKLFYLRQLPADEVMQAATSRNGNAPRFGTIVDGYFLPDTIAHIYADGKQAHVPLLAGWNSDDVPGNPPPPVPKADAFVAQLRNAFGDRLKDALAVYPMSTDAEALRSAGDYVSDRAIGYSTWAWIEAHARTGNAPVYRYHFELPNPGDRNHTTDVGAYHSDDIEYVFGTLDSRPQMNSRPQDRALSDLMQQYWVNFARTGDPNGAGLPQWPSYNNATGTLRMSGTASGDAFPVMHLDATSSAKLDDLHQRYLFLDQFWGAQTK